MTDLFTHALGHALGEYSAQIKSIADTAPAIESIAGQSGAIETIANQQGDLGKLNTNLEDSGIIAGLKANLESIADTKDDLGGIADQQSAVREIVGQQGNFTGALTDGFSAVGNKIDGFGGVAIFLLLAIGVFTIFFYMNSKYKSLSRYVPAGGSGSRRLEENFLGDCENVFAGATMVLLLLLVAFVLKSLYRKPPAKTARRCATFAVEECNDDTLDMV